MYGHGVVDSQSVGLSTLTVNFEVSSFVSSGVHIRFLSPVHSQLQSVTASGLGISQQSSQLQQWVRYVTIAESFIVRF